MKKWVLLLIAVAASPAFANQYSNHLRVDCRFYADKDNDHGPLVLSFNKDDGKPHEGHEWPPIQLKHPRFCYASAIYEVDDQTVDHVRFGVGCDYQTIFDDKAISSPQSTLADGIHPRTAATPRLEITPERSLRHPGTYTAKLELASGILKDGVCYVREVSRDEGDYPLFFNEWLFQE